MKRIAALLTLLVFSILVFSPVCHAAGAMTGGTSAWARLGSSDIWYKSVTLTDDGSGTTDTLYGYEYTLANPKYAIDQLNGAIILSARTNPGSPAPTDNYDIVVSSSTGQDVFTAQLMNRDTANTETVSQLDPLVFLDGDLTVTLSNNTEAGAIVVLTVYVQERKRP